ncbi:ABC transporter permease [Thiolinea disciformis]|uniref:ABC transporter permease n=1 Tax=Thiolinea disciformis TaxID=125614 RepID=UPI0003731874|nr:FtsX-like permease family protein [Thiolinea disciformis]
MSSFWQVALTQWQRRWRLPEMRLLFLALLVSAMAVASVGFFTNRVDQAMQRQASQLLGGDLVLNSARPLSEEYVAQAETLGIKVARTVKLNSMVMVGERLQLAQIKAISANYPLQGAIELSNTLGVTGETLEANRLNSGEVWAEARLLNELQIQPNTDVQIGEKSFRLNYVLIKDPAEAANPFQLAANVLMPLEDLDSTQLLSPASRAEYSLLFAGSPSAIRQFRTSIANRLQPTERIRSLEDGARPVRQALERAGRFLGLAALLSVVLAGAAIALAAASLIKHETRAVAVLKAIGLPRKRILWDYLLNVLALALLAGCLGAVLGFGLQFFLANWLANIINLELPAPTLAPALTAILTATIMVAGFAIPYLLNLVSQAPVRILQGDVPMNNPVAGLMALSILPAIFLLLWLQAGELVLAVWLLLGLLAAILIFWLSTRLILTSLIKLSAKPRFNGLSVLRQARRSSLLVVVFAMGLFALLLLTALRTDLVGRWQASLPADAPNYFMINIQPQEVEAVQEFFKQNQLKGELFPMIRGRLVEINGKPLDPDQLGAERAQRLARREFNLSSFAVLPSSNKILEGKWFDAQSRSGFSIEQEIGKDLGFGLGDTLTFDIAGQRFTEKITSVRSVSWDSMQPNFFVTAAPHALDDKPRTFITSVYVPAAQAKAIPELIRRYPSITAIDTSAIAKQVRNLIEQVSFSVQGIFSFTLVTGILVLLAALQSQKAERRREIAVLKSLGAGRLVLRKRIITEFVLLGAIAGSLAGLFTVLTSNVVGSYLFELEWNLNLWLVLAGFFIGALLVASAAYGNLRGLLGVPPAVLLKS